MIWLLKKNYKDENDNDPSPPVKAVTVKTSNTISEVSAASSDILWAANKKVLKVLVDVNGGTHSLVRYYITMNPSGRKRVNMAFCHLPDRDCFQKHVLMIKRKTRFS